MNPDVSQITKITLEIEHAINARWNKGNCTGFLEAYREDVTYFDPLTDRCLMGRQAVKEHFDKVFTGAPIVRSDQSDPKVVVNDAGDIAILTYNLQNYLAGKDGEPEPIPLWNCTQVYRLADGKWNIAHNHWSFARLPAVVGNISA
ncbi:MAG: SgcJ/EcaC family oxidoreductase [Planctomycetaceae bacterium]